MHTIKTIKDKMLITHSLPQFFGGDFRLAGAELHPNLTARIIHGDAFGSLNRPSL
jgi:hypothetical protein